MFRKLLILSLAAGLSLPAAAQTIRSYITRADRSDLFTPQEKTIQFSPQRQERGNYIVIDPRQTYQRIDGFGYALTGGSAEHLMKMSPEARKSGVVRSPEGYRRELCPADARRLGPQQFCLLL